MNTRRHRRVHNDQSGLRRWLASAIFARKPLEPRRLGCERLERRYALHGTDWFDESFQAAECRETPERYSQSESAQKAIVRSFDRSGSMRSVTPTRFHRYVLDEDRLTGQGSEESLVDDLSEHDCERPRGMRGEGEGPGETPARIGQRPDMGLLSRPEPKLDGVQPVGNSSRGTLNLKEPFAGEANNSVLGHPAPDHGLPATVAEAPKPTLPSGSSHIPQFVVEVPGQARTGLTNFLGTRNIVQLPATTQNEQSSFASVASVKSSSDVATPWVNNNSTEVAIVSNATNLRTNVDSSSESSTSISFTTIQIGDGSANDRLAATNLSRRTVADSSSAIADTESAGLLKQLRSVIEKLASDSQAEKPEMDSSNRLQHSQSNSQSAQFASSNRKQIAVEDGMLELAAATDKLSTSTLIVTDRTSSNDLAQHRSQLLASLELHRDFDLAGRVAGAIESVEDPTQQLKATDEAVEAVAHWSIPFSPSAGESTDQAQSSGSMWQRSLLPLSFLAIGGMLLRKKSRAKRKAVFFKP